MSAVILDGKQKDGREHKANLFVHQWHLVLYIPTLYKGSGGSLVKAWDY